jgi:hypothetical protein
MGIVITSHTDSFTIDLGGLSAERKKARIHFTDIRSLVADTDNATVEIVFSSGEIYSFPFVVVDEIDGDTNISTQDILYDKMEAIIF